MPSRTRAAGRRPVVRPTYGPPGRRLALVPDVGVGLSRERLPARSTCDGAAGGEAFLPAGGAHHRPLRKWLQEHDVLPWRREHLPLLFAGDRLVAVATWALPRNSRPADEPSWRIVWHGAAR